MGRCQILLENEIFKKLVSRRKHDVYHNLLVNGCSDIAFQKTQWTNTSRWHCTPNHHRLWKLNTGLQATWDMSFSTLPPDSRTSRTTNVSEHFCFAEIIHPPHRCGISYWLDSMIIVCVGGCVCLWVCLRLATINGHCIMFSFITQHNATDVASFEGACNWQADCRNVHQSSCLWIECSFLYHKPSPKAFQRIWQ